MRSLVPVQMASRLVAGLAHILALGKRCKKLRPHCRKLCPKCRKIWPCDRNQHLLRRIKQRVACADAEAILRLSPVLADVSQQRNRFYFAAREQDERPLAENRHGAFRLAVLRQKAERFSTVIDPAQIAEVALGCQA